MGAKICAVACALSVASSFVVPRSARSQTLVVRSKTYDEETDVNVLMTALNAAVAREDFREASSCKKRLDALRGGAAAEAPQQQRRTGLEPLPVLPPDGSTGPLRRAEPGAVVATGSGWDDDGT